MDGTLILVMWVLALVIVAFVIVMIWLTSQAKATEYIQIDRTHIVYCDEYARRSSRTMVGMTKAYGDCIRVLPTRLPMPEEPGTVPAGDRLKNENKPGNSDPAWEEACAAEYVSWEPETGTVVRRGSPERVKCPLVLRDGEWVLDAP